MDLSPRFWPCPLWNLILKEPQSPSASTCSASVNYTNHRAKTLRKNPASSKHGYIVSLLLFLHKIQELFRQHLQFTRCCKKSRDELYQHYAKSCLGFEHSCMFLSLAGWNQDTERIPRVQYLQGFCDAWFWRATSTYKSPSTVMQPTGLQAMFLFFLKSNKRKRRQPGMVA